MNLAATCARSLEGRAASEILRVVSGLGDAGAAARRIDGMPGIVLARTALDPLLVPRAVRRALDDEPWTVRHLYRVIPLQRWLPADADGIVKVASEMAAAGIGAGESYRITVEKRSTGLSAREIVSRTADLIASAATAAGPGVRPPRVSLESPDRIVLVEIFGPHAGVSVISPADLLSAEREKRAASDAGDGGPLD